MSETTSAAPTATEIPEPEPKNLVMKLTDGTFVKRRITRQRACDEPKGKKICAGHLKRWYGFGDELVAAFGKDPEIYRCERCQVLYLPNESEVARTGTLAF
ncbi:MAG: hypothetical protein OXC19_20965 [Bryobacterales bacterium]|nr:hypothetical protein [Bryobacterales bacterium]